MSNDEVRIKLEAWATGTKSEPWTLNYRFAKLVGKWLGDRDSNPDYMVQSHAWCHYTIPQSLGCGGHYTKKIPSGEGSLQVP